MKRIKFFGLIVAAVLVAGGVAALGTIGPR